MNRLFFYMEHSGLGNMITATPFLKALRYTYPHDKICVSCWDRSVEAIKDAKFIDDIYLGPPHLYLQERRQSGIKNITTIVSPVGSLVNNEVAQLSSHLITAPVKAPWIKHESEYKMDLLQKCILAEPPDFARNTDILAGKDLSPEFPLDVSTLHLTLHKFHLKNAYVVINASYLRTDHWFRKHWGNKNYAELIKLIMQQSPELDFVLVGTQEDSAESDLIRQMAGGYLNIHNLCGKTSIKEVAQILHAAYFVVGNDSGLAHISSALGQNTYTIFMFTNIIKNAPMGSRSKILCVPCDKRITCQHGFWNKCEDRICQTLTPQDVMTKLNIK